MSREEKSIEKETEKNKQDYINGENGKWASVLRDYTIKKDSNYGYYTLDPLPTEKELERYYRERYLASSKNKNRAPDLRRQLSDDASQELEWLHKTLYLDIVSNLGNPGRLLDVGCGLGNFSDFMRKKGWKTFGVEPSSDEANIAIEKGLDVYNGTFNNFTCQEYFNAITLLNVLEHLPNPKETLRKASRLLVRNGVICLRVPNDFNILQESAQKKLGCQKWWVTVPDHINYFNCASLSRLANDCNFKIIQVLSDFPMEMFLLMGDDYVTKPELGGVCHSRRRNFELSIPLEVRQRLYKSLAEQGLGRNILLFAMKR